MFYVNKGEYTHDEVERLISCGNKSDQTFMHLLKDFVIPFCFNSKLHFIESTEGARFT